MSAGAQDNFPTGGAGVVTPRVPPSMLGRILGRGRERTEGPRFGGFRNIFFILLLTGISVLAIYPFLWLLSASLKPQGDVFDNRLIPREWQWNYTGDPSPVRGDERLFALPDVPIEKWFMNSVWIGLLAATLVALSSAIVAFAFAYFRFPARNALFALILATMMLPGAVTMIPVYLIWNKLSVWTGPGTPAPGDEGMLAFLPDIGVNTQYPLWVPNLFGSAFYIFLMRQFFLGIPRDLFEAARIDGDTYWTMFRRIAMPLAKPALIVVFIFEFQAQWFDLLKPLIYLRDTALFTMPLGLKTILDQQGAGGGGEGRWEIIMAGTVVTVLPMVVLFAIFQRYFIQGIATQGRKGYGSRLMSTAAGALPAVEGDGAATRRLALGLDIGGTKLAAGVVDASGRVHSFAVEPSRGEEGPEAVLGRLFELGSRAVAESGVSWEEIDRIGIGCGGPLDAARGVVLSPPHLPGWVDVPVTALAEEAYGREAVLENDATAAAAAEHHYGAGAGTRNMIYLTISTGVGGGVVIDGRLYRGSMGNGGELGHVTVDCNGRRCHGCGRIGCLEAYVSGTSIAERAQEALAKRPHESVLADVDTPTAADVTAAARAGDPLAQELWDETTDALGCGLTSIVNLFEPEMVVLGGGVTRSGEQLLARVRETVGRTAMSPAGRATQIVLSALGDQVGVVGAAAIAFEQVSSGGRAAA